MIATVLVAALALQTAGFQAMRGQTPPPPPEDLLVVLALPVHEPDGNITIETVTMPASGPGVVHAFTRKSVCLPGVGTSEPSEAGVAWRIATQVVTRSPTQIVVSIDWRRIFDGGRKVSNGPAGAVQLTLQPGGRIPLDFVPNLKPGVDCRAVGAGLEVRAVRGVPPGPAIDTALLPVGATPGGGGALNAEFWLLHNMPGDRLGTSHQVMRISVRGGSFSFPALIVPTARGDLQVEFMGSIARYRTPDGGEYLSVSLRRVLAGAGLPQSASAWTTSVIPLTLDEVVAFEMPAIAAGRGGGGGGRGGGGGGARIGAAPPTTSSATATGTAAGSQGGLMSREAGATGLQTVSAASLLQGHSFSLRMRVSPVPGPQ